MLQNRACGHITFRAGGGLRKLQDAREGKRPKNPLPLQWREAFSPSEFTPLEPYRSVRPHRHPTRTDLGGSPNPSTKNLAGTNFPKAVITIISPKRASNRVTMSADSENGNGDDYEDSFLAISEDLVQSPEHKRAGDSSLDFDGLLATPLRLHEDLKEGCGGQLWPAGMVLARYLLRQKREELAGKSVYALSFRFLLLQDGEATLENFL
jgi:hypothetical protein